METWLIYISSASTLLLGLLVGYGLSLLRSQKKLHSEKEKQAALESKLEVLTTRSIEDRQQLEQLSELLAEKQDYLAEINKNLGSKDTLIENLREKIAQHTKDLQDKESAWKKEFQLIASQIVEKSSSQIYKRQEKGLQDILSPFKEKIKEFEEKVHRNYSDETKQRSELKQQISHLYELNQTLGKEAKNLTKALKGDTKMQGNWGEVVLERVLERSGLTKGREYDTQSHLKSKDGKRLHPDVVVRLPEDKHIIIDSKVSLVAYEAYVSAENPKRRENHLRNHILSIQTHIKNLSEKQYQVSVNVTSPDFVLLFLPLESAFSLAMQGDSDLYAYAWKRNIVIVSPTTLLATLRTVSSIWKQERQTKNALEIADKAGKMYDKFMGFLEDMSKLGIALNKAREQYDQSLNKLQLGPGNLIRRAQQLKEMGAPATKKLPLSFGSALEEDENTLLQNSKNESDNTKNIAEGSSDETKGDS